MKIISFKKINKNSYELLLDNNKTLTLFEEVILSNDLLITKNVDQKSLSQLMEENSEYDGYYNAIKLLSRRNKSSKEVSDYLKTLGIDAKIVQNIIKKLTSQSYLNDKNYSEMFINDSVKIKYHGPAKIKSDLLSKGINLDYINQGIAKIDFNVWINNAKKLVIKKLNVNKGSIKQFKIKMSQYLYTMGYSSDIISICLNDINEKDDYNKFEKFASKKYEQLKKRYPEEEEVIWKFKQAAFQKGYSSDLIDKFLQKK